MLESVQRRYEEGRLHHVFIRLDGEPEEVFLARVRELVATLRGFAPGFAWCFDREDGFCSIGLPPPRQLGVAKRNGVFAVLEANPLCVSCVDPRTPARSYQGLPAVDND